MQSAFYGLATNADAALEAAQANLSPRQKELESLERFALGTQYDGRPSWWTADVPLWERAPCIVYLQTKGAIQSNTDLVLGEARFPVVTSNPGEDDSKADGLDPDESKDVDRAIRELCDRVRFRSVSRQVLEHGQQAKSAAGIFGAREGHPFIEVVRSRWCEPKFDVRRRVTELEIRYPYIKWEKQLDGKWKLSAKLYRRVINAASDTTFEPIPAPKDGREPAPDAWVPDEARTVKHKLGFCPVVWYAHMRECSTVEDYDGEAIHQNITDEIQGLDFALSQKHRAALFCGDPQVIELGVEPGYNPSQQTGRQASVPSSRSGGMPGANNATTGSYGGGSQAVRVKSPGTSWQYPNENTKVEYLTLEKGALGELDDHCADLRNKIAESLQVVVLDPQNLKLAAAISGKAIEQLRSRQFDRCDQIRDDISSGWILPAVKMLLRVAIKARVALPSVLKVMDALAKFADDDINSPLLLVKWPNGYLAPDPADEQIIVQTAVQAKKEGIATKRMAVEKVARIFGVDSVDQAVDALDEEEALGAQKRQAEMAAGLGALHGPPDAASDEGADPDSGATGGNTPPAPSSVGGGGSDLPKTPAIPKTTPSAHTKPQSKPKTGAAPARAAATLAAPHERGSEPNGAIAETVYRMLLEDYRPEDIAWVRAAQWTGPNEVPLESIDFSGRDDWNASDEPDRVQHFADKIANEGFVKPIVLVSEPNDDRFVIVDGHHRALAYEQLEQSPMAYVASVGTVTGPWSDMHSSQRKKKDAQPRETGGARNPPS